MRNRKKDPKDPKNFVFTKDRYVAVKGDGTIVCYFIYDRVGFMDYLIAHTKMERPSTSRHDYAKIFKTHNGQYMMKLNLQVRFMQ